MVIQPVWRHGFEIEALAKQAFLAPSDLYSEVSVISPSMYCSHGSDSSPSKVASRCSFCSSKSAWTNHSSLSPVASSAGSSAEEVSSAASGSSRESSVLHAVSTAVLRLHRWLPS